MSRKHRVTFFAAAAIALTGDISVTRLPSRKDGKVVEWVAETQAPSTVYPRVFHNDSFQPRD